MPKIKQTRKCFKCGKFMSAKAWAESNLCPKCRIKQVDAKGEAFYYPEWATCEDEEEDIKLCDYTGEECFGNPAFCEECEVVTSEGE